MKKIARILIILVGGFLVAWIVFNQRTRINPNPQITTELSERSQQFIEDRKAEQDQTWRLARLETTDAPSAYVANNPCFRVTIPNPLETPRTQLGSDSCSFQATSTDPHGKLLISMQPNTRPLHEDTGVIFRERNPDFVQLDPINPERLPPEILEQIRFESESEHLTLLRTSNSLLTISFSQISRKPDDLSALVDDIIGSIQFNI